MITFNSRRVSDLISTEVSNFARRGLLHRQVAEVVMSDYFCRGNDTASGADYACNLYCSVGNSSVAIFGAVLDRRYNECTAETVQREVGVILPVIEEFVSILSWWADRAENGDLD